MRRANLLIAMVVGLCLHFGGSTTAGERSNKKESPQRMKPITIGLIGDSTVASTYGWGPGFADRMRKEVTVLNVAKNGGILDTLSKPLDSLLKKKPDYVLIQFGHNDMKRYGTEDYSDKLRNYVERIRRVGGQAVILSSVTRRGMGADKKISHGAIKGRRLPDYGKAAAAVASEMRVPFVDLLTLSVEQHNRVGPKVVATYNFVKGDRTHFSPAGEKVIADLVLKEIKKLIPELAPYILKNLAGPRVRKPLSQKFEKVLFDDADKEVWQETFSDPCTRDWKKNWFLDGEVGTVKTGKDGMTLNAGKEWKNDAHHMVLWSKEEFKGDLNIEYDWTRQDNENRGVNILYVQAAGSGKAPYAKDITRWNDLRKVPAMKTYYNNMHTYHISYAAFVNDGKATKSYIRGRRYMPNQSGLKGTNLWPEYASDTLFAKGVKHHITIIKKDRGMFLRIEAPKETFYCHMDNTELPIISEGRIGLRHMFTRTSTYKNFSISTRAK
jgi:lysophospholipase L1-like esterase